MLERDLSQPDRIVGELLQPGGYLKLKELGLADCVKEIDSQKVSHSVSALSSLAHLSKSGNKPGLLQVYGYCILKNGKEAKIGYPTKGFDADISGRSFHNGRFVQRLRQAAARQPNVTVREATVKRLLNGTDRAGRSAPRGAH